MSEVSRLLAIDQSKDLTRYHTLIILTDFSVRNPQMGAAPNGCKSLYISSSNYLFKQHMIIICIEILVASKIIWLLLCPLILSYIPHSHSCSIRYISLGSSVSTCYVLNLPKLNHFQFNQTPSLITVTIQGSQL